MDRFLEGRDTLQLSGGGLKTLAFCGALENIDMTRFRVFGGVSGGSVLALAFVLGYKPSEAADLLGQAGLVNALAQTMSPVRMLVEGSLLSQGPMLEAVARWMQAKNFPADGTFEDLRRHSKGVSLRVVVCTTGTAPHLIVLDETSAPREQVLRAVRASTAVPLAFPPVWVAGKLCIDPGTINNLSLFAAGDPRKTLALLAGRDFDRVPTMLCPVPAGLSQLAACGFDRMNLLVDAELVAMVRLARVVHMPTMPGPNYNLFRLGSGTRSDIECLLQQGRNAMSAALIAPELASLLCIFVAFGLTSAAEASPPPPPASDTSSTKNDTRDNTNISISSV